jgi:hypothetical protein
MPYRSPIRKKSSRRTPSPKKSPRRSLKRSKSKSPKGRRSPNSMTVQSIAFPKSWKQIHIHSWLRYHNYHPIKEDSTANFIRFRIRQPHRNAVFATKILPNDVHLIMMKD